MQNKAGRVVKTRSRQACKRCHDRRVRCDVAARGVPCSGCAASGAGGACRLLQSRKVRGEDGRFSGLPCEPQSPRPVSGGRSGRPPDPDTPQQPLTSDRHQHGGGDDAAAPAEDDAEEDVETVRRPASEAEQWSNIISSGAAPVPDGRRMTYFGESWNLSYMIQWRSHEASHDPADSAPHASDPSPSAAADDDNRPSLHIAMPVSQEDTPSPRSATALSRLRDQLPSGSQAALVDAYFGHHHVHYPVMAEHEFRERLAAGVVSPLLLSAVLYAGAIHVPDPVIHRAGFDTRQACLRKLYARSRNLFFEGEADSEIGDQLSRVQAAFLLHHMWLSPNSTMDCWTWLSLAIRLAQNMGMHRSTSRAALSDDHRKLWKRIWWSLYVSSSPISLSPLGAPLAMTVPAC